MEDLDMDMDTGTDKPLKCLRCRTLRKPGCLSSDLYCDGCDEFYARVRKMSQRVSPPGRQHIRTLPISNAANSRKSQHSGEAT